MYWFNFKTGAHDHLPGSASMTFTEEQAKQYIPQDDPTQNLFRCYVGTGLSVADALLKTLEAVCGVPAGAGAVRR